MIKLKFYFLIIFHFFVISNTSKASHLNFLQYLEQPKTNPLTKHSPEEMLRDAYQKIRHSKSLNEFEVNAKDFEKAVFYPIDMDKIPYQGDYIEELKDLHNKLNHISSRLFHSFFENHRSRLRHRLSLAKIDQEIRLKRGAIRGSFNQPGLPINVQKVLNHLVGKIFHIYKDGNSVKRVRYSASGMLACLTEENSLENLIPGNACSLNGVVTNAHVIERDKEERTTGIYFVPNNCLDPSTWFPRLNSDASPISDENELINYLEDNLNSYQIVSYILKNVIPSHHCTHSENDIIFNNPKYLANQDIIYGKILLNRRLAEDLTPIIMQEFKRYNSGTITINFDTMKGKFIPKFREWEKYFAIGYPSCDQYDLSLFENNVQYPLITFHGYSPLVITSAFANGGIPAFIDGKIHHTCNTAVGMSGSPLIKLSNDKQQITVFGIHASTLSEHKEGCY